MDKDWIFFNVFIIISNAFFINICIFNQLLRAVCKKIYLQMSLLE